MAILSKPLLFKLDDEKCDMEFQFVGNDDDEEYVPSLKKAKTTKKTQLCDKLEVLRAHKLLLSYISPVLHTQFYESMHENGRVDIVGGLEIVKIKEFSCLAFSSCIKHEYGDKDVVKHCDDFELLFEMLLVCKKYLLDDLFKSIKRRLHRIKISRENLFEFLKVVDQWKGLLGFEQICAELTRKCAVQIKKSFKTSQEVIEFVSNNKDDYLLGTFFHQMHHTDLKCSNCKVEDCLNGKPVLTAKPPVGLKIKVAGSSDENMMGVVQSVQDSNRNDPWGSKISIVSVMLSTGNLWRPVSSDNFTSISYNCCSQDLTEEANDCGNCQVEKCLRGKVITAASSTVAVGTKVRLTGTERTGVVIKVKEIADKDPWGADTFLGRVRFSDGKECVCAYSCNRSPLSFDC